MRPCALASGLEVFSLVCVVGCIAGQHATPSSGSTYSSLQCGQALVQLAALGCLHLCAYMLKQAGSALAGHGSTASTAGLRNVKHHVSSSFINKCIAAMYMAVQWLIPAEV
jgi:hypothetical protein